MAKLNQITVGSTTYDLEDTEKYTKPSGGIPASDLAETYYLASNPSGYTDDTVANTKEPKGKITVGGTEYTVRISTTDAGEAGFITFVVGS